MEVDGDLNVSGDIQSPTIAQLQEIIAQLQAQITALQQGADNKLESRFYTLPRINIQDEDYYLNIDEIVGEELNVLFPLCFLSLIGWY